ATCSGSVNIKRAHQSAGGIMCETGYMVESVRLGGLPACRIVTRERFMSKRVAHERLSPRRIVLILRAIAALIDPGHELAGSVVLDMRPRIVGGIVRGIIRINGLY